MSEILVLDSFFRLHRSLLMRTNPKPAITYAQEKAMYPTQECPPRPQSPQEIMRKAVEEAKNHTPDVYTYLHENMAVELGKKMVEDDNVTLGHLAMHYAHLGAKSKLRMAMISAIPLAMDKASLQKWTVTFYEAVNDD